MTEPYSKEKQLARGEKRYRRKVASPKEWQAIVAAKQGPCRVCNDPATNGRLYGHIEFHHLISRAQGGDDVPENICPLCGDCHEQVTRREPVFLLKLATSLEADELAYITTKLRAATTGAALQRLFGVTVP